MTQVTIIGNLTAEPELRFTASGAAVAGFTIAHTPRVKQGDQWVDGEALYLRCTLWREAAENACDSLEKGSRVIAIGKLKQRSYETREGEKRTVVELEVEEIGPSLKWSIAKPQKMNRANTKAPKTEVRDDDPWPPSSEDAPF